MAKATEQKKKTAGKRPAASGTRTVKNSATHRSFATDEKKKSTSRVKKDELKTQKPQKQGSSRTPSESWNVVMPFLLGVMGALIALFYIFIFADKIKNGVADAGAVGNFLNNLLMWLLGWAAYMIPAALIVMAFRWRGITARGRCHGGLWVQFVLVLVLTSAIFELLFGEVIVPAETRSIAVSNAWNTYAQQLFVFRAEESTLIGGSVGAALAIVMYWALTKVLSAIVLILLDLVLIALMLGITPTAIVRYSQAHREARLQRRAERLQEFEDARRAEKEAAKAEREANVELKAKEKRLKKEEEAVRRVREREEKRRAEADAELKKELEREKDAANGAAQPAADTSEKAERPVEEKNESGDETAIASADGERTPTEVDTASAEDTAMERVTAETDASAAEEPLSEDTAGGTAEESAGIDPAVEPVEDAEDSMPIVGETHPLATDLDFGLDENSAKLPRSRLPGDAELFGSFETETKKSRNTAVTELGEGTEQTAAEEISEIGKEIDPLGIEITPVSEQEETSEPALPSEPEYIYPPTALLVEGKPSADVSEFADEIEAKKEELAAVLTSFGVRFRSIEFSRGPTITRYEIQPEPGQRVKAIQNLMDDIALSMAVSGVRFEPSIQGKAAVGIEVPNTTRETVTLRSLVESDTFTSEKSKLTACLGADITGKPVVFDVSKMPHLLVAGATGMGKSVCINSIIVSLMYKATPDEVRLILVDPKKVEFAMYRDMPHLLTPIITDPQKAAGALCSAVSEMEKRFELIERVGARDIAGYKKITAGDPDMPRMCHIVIIIDELADLMMTASNDVEAAIMRIAQKARAAGIHLIIGTQRPSVDVITGTIKANIPSRIACTVASQTDSRTILDSQGAEKLCGRGDMLFAPVGASRPRRVQGSFVSEDEVVRVVNFMINNNGTAVYDEQFMENINIEAERCAKSKKASSEAAMVAECEEDPKLDEAVELAIECGKVATSLLQRRLGVGYGRAAKIIDRMEQLGVVSAADGNKPRQVLITLEEYRERLAARDADAESTDEE